MMLEGNRSFVDPTDVLNLVYDETSNRVDIGEQKDIIEYLMIFFEHVEIGLNMCDEDQKEVSRSGSLISKTKFDLKLMDIFKGKLVAEILESQKTMRNNNLVEEDFGPLLVEVRHSDLIEALRQKFQYSIKMNNNEVT